MASNYAVSGLGNQAIEVDPSATGNIIRFAMLFESILNLPAFVALTFYPGYTLTYFLVNEHDITPAAQSFTQLMGIMILMISVLLWAAIPNTKSGVETRRPTYIMLASAEAAMVTMWIYQRYGLGEKGCGWKNNALDMSVMNVGPLCGFRIFALYSKPDWFGRYKVKAKST